MVDVSVVVRKLTPNTCGSDTLSAETQREAPADQSMSGGWEVSRQTCA